MDPYVDTWLPDVTEMPLAELVDSDDPVLREAAARIAEQISSYDRADGCC